MRRIKIKPFIVLTLLFPAVLAQSVPTEQELPLRPSIVRDVNLIYDQQYSRPQIPPLRTTSDGRVAMQTKTRSNRADDKVFEFFLLAPEKLTRSFQDSPRGTSILASPTSFKLSRANFVDTQDSGESIHSAFCESETLPKTCGVNGANDCYRFNVVTPFYNNLKNRMEIWKTPVEVEIRNPKTALAQILSITTGKPRMGVTWANISSLLETVITKEGRLLVGRVANSPVTWTDANSGARKTSNPNVIYSYIPQNQEACDVSKLQGPYPITHAHYQSAMRQNYGFAAYPMRDGTGNLIPNGADFGGSYAWLDSQGNNLFFGTFSNSILNGGSPEYRLRCVGGGECGNPTENLTKDTIGFSVSGLWTKGRTVLLDNALNNIDWNLQARPSGHAEAKLYRGDQGWIHVGSGRDNANDTASHMPPGGVGNINIIDSVENKLNAFSALKPSIPKDVGWWVSTGKSTDFVAFDDWLNPQILINSSMVQAIRGVDLEPDLARLQNAATTQLYNAPRYAEIVGAGRVEPAALGGVQGKGFFAWAEGGLRYAIPQNGNTGLAEKDWYLGVFVDPRFDNDGQARRLIEFPDGSAINLLGLDRIVYAGNATNQQQIRLPQMLVRNQFNHLGFRIKRNRDIELLLNGMLVNRWQRPSGWNGFFTIQAGDLWLGRGATNTNGFVGWLDEFKVIADAGQQNAEELCNQASGSLVGITSSAPVELQQKSSLIPASGIELVNQNLSMEFHQDRYWCYTENRSADGWVNLSNLPTGTVSLRQPILFPEGPLVADYPRPDSTGNAFCRSCHQNDGSGRLPVSLTIEALAQTDLSAKVDPRRQPGQPPAKIYGNIPADLFGAGQPQRHRFADEGLFVDEFVLER